MHAGTAGRIKADERFLAGDAVRGIAAVAIIVFHVWSSVRLGFVARGDVGAFTAFGPFEYWLGHLDLSVYVFFVLSGYLIGRPFIGAILGQREFPDMRRYTRNRVLRIVPAFWVAWTLTLLIWGTHGAGLADIAAVYLTMQDYVNQGLTTQQFVHGWTVGVEVLFYVGIPIAAAAAMWMIRRLRLPAWPAVLGLLGLGVLGGLAVRGANTDGYQYLHSFPAFGFAFMPGMFLAAVEVRYADRLRGANWGKPAAWGLVALAAALYTAFVVSKPQSVVVRSVYDLFTAASVVAAPLVLQWTTGRNWRVLANRVSVWLGSRSYSIYLYHVGALYALQSVAFRQSDALTGFFVLTPVVLLATFVVAELSFRFVESPALRLRAGRAKQAAEEDAKAAEKRAAARALLASFEDADTPERKVRASL